MKSVIGDRDDYIAEGLKEIELVAITLPEDLPLLINKEWSSQGNFEYYKMKLADAEAMMDAIKRYKKDPYGPIVF